MSSPIKLAPETVKIRNALIEKFSNKPIEDLNLFIDDALMVEKDEFKRLGLLAARVHILRQRVLTLKAFNRDDTMEKLPSVHLTLPEVHFSDLNTTIEDEPSDENDRFTDWHSLKMIEPGEVNGVRFFIGTIINASAEDADKLISSGKAIVVDNDGNPVATNDTTTDEIMETEGTETEVTEAEGVEAEVTETEGAETEVTKTEGVETEVTETEGVATAVTETEGVETAVTETEGAETEVTETEGVETEVTKTEGVETEVTDK